MGRSIYLLSMVLVLGALSACQSGPSGQTSSSDSDLGDAILTPLSDLNLVKEDIPPVLKALSSPYDEVPERSCDEIAEMVVALTQVLGPDADEKKAKDGSDMDTDEVVSDATLDFVSGATGGIIPLRGIVRSVTGASDHEEKVISAYRRGIERRAYLKGIGDEKGCAPPAAPR